MKLPSCVWLGYVLVTWSACFGGTVQTCLAGLAMMLLPVALTFRGEK